MARRRIQGDHTRIGGDLKPTLDTYDELQRAFDFFNTELFGSRLPQCLITLSRQHDTLGYFSANQFVNLSEGGKGEYCHEITLNPTYFAIRSIPENLSVMVREMVSLAQVLEGKPPRRRYRNREWADMCEAIGLMPSDTGKPGGKRVGDSVQTYIIDCGLFDLASAKLIDSEFKLSWVDRFPPEQPAGASEEPAATILADGGNSQAPAHAQNAESRTANPLDQLDELDSDDEGGGVLLDVEGEGDLPADAKPVNAFKKVADPEPEVPDDAPRMKVFAHAQTAELAQLGIEPQKATKNPSKSKYSCTVKTCKGNVWGKPGMRVSCMGTDKKPHDPELMVFDGAVTLEEPVETF
jgi:hypothetical protein